MTSTAIRNPLVFLNLFALLGAITAATFMLGDHRGDHLRHMAVMVAIVTELPLSCYLAALARFL